MRPSFGRALQVISRSRLATANVASVPRLRPSAIAERTPTVMEVLQQRKVANGASWPPNLRLEPPLTKAGLLRVNAQERSNLKKLLKER
ncbi:hypothetical protein FISHEDRAFT_53234 [Fistulina hepatica ATCC 64428]|nr:hypothetical protein FISHEDRAFT_53234 [Fistulina hepatica ATCC 64428]